MDADTLDLLNEMASLRQHAHVDGLNALGGDDKTLLMAIDTITRLQTRIDVLEGEERARTWGKE
jgi:hypothetical protein